MSLMRWLVICLLLMIWGCSSPSLEGIWLNELGTVEGSSLVYYRFEPDGKVQITRVTADPGQQDEVRSGTYSLQGNDLKIQIDKVARLAGGAPRDESISLHWEIEQDAGIIRYTDQRTLNQGVMNRVTSEELQILEKEIHGAKAARSRRSGS